jgi:hypothetical protein
LLAFVTYEINLIVLSKLSRNGGLPVSGSSGIGFQVFAAGNYQMLVF